MSEIAQLQLDGDRAEIDGRDRPDTLLWCHECLGYVLRSRREQHPHELYLSREEFIDELSCPECSTLSCEEHDSPTADPRG
jgi:hypothetical protein